MIQSFHSQTSSSGGEKHIQTSNHTLTWRRGWSNWANLCVSEVIRATIYTKRRLGILTLLFPFYARCLQNKALFSTYVVASGLQYGMGEQILHYFFKVGSKKLFIIVSIVGQRLSSGVKVDGWSCCSLSSALGQDTQLQIAPCVTWVDERPLFKRCRSGVYVLYILLFVSLDFMAGKGPRSHGVWRRE